MSVSTGSVKLVVTNYAAVGRLAKRMVISYSLLSGLMMYLGIAAKEPSAIVCGIILVCVTGDSVHYIWKAEKMVPMVMNMQEKNNLTPKNMQQYTTESFKDTLCVQISLFIANIALAAQFLLAGYSTTPTAAEIILYGVLMFICVVVVIVYIRLVAVTYRAYRHF